MVAVAIEQYFLFVFSWWWQLQLNDIFFLSSVDGGSCNWTIFTFCLQLMVDVAIEYFLFVFSWWWQLQLNNVFFFVFSWWWQLQLNDWLQWLCLIRPRYFQQGRTPSRSLLQSPWEASVCSLRQSILWNQCNYFTFFQIQIITVFKAWQQFMKCFLKFDSIQLLLKCLVSQIFSTLTQH